MQISTDRNPPRRVRPPISAELPRLRVVRHCCCQALARPRATRGVGRAAERENQGHRGDQSVEVLPPEGLGNRSAQRQKDRLCDQRACGGEHRVVHVGAYHPPQRADPGENMAEDMVQQMVASYSFKANLRVIRTQDEMLGSLLDLHA